MFDKQINNANIHFFKKDEKKFITWFNIEVNYEGKYKKPKNFNELIDILKQYYGDLDINKLYEEKKKLELNTNNFNPSLYLTGYFSNLITIFGIFTATFISIITGINFTNNAIKNEMLTTLYNKLLTPFLTLIIVSFIVNWVDIKLSGQKKKSYNLLCLSIINDIEKEIEESKKLLYLKQIKSNTEYFKNVVNNISEIENIIYELEQKITKEEDDDRLDIIIE